MSRWGQDGDTDVMVVLDEVVAVRERMRRTQRRAVRVHGVVGGGLTHKGSGGLTLTGSAPSQRRTPGLLDEDLLPTEGTTVTP